MYTTLISFTAGAIAKMGSGTSEDSSPSIWLDSLNCSGSEDSLFLCPVDHDCSAGERAGVKCSTPQG